MWKKLTNFYRFDGGSHSLTKSDLFQIVDDQKSKKDRLQSFKNGTDRNAAPLLVTGVRMELEKLISGLGKGVLSDILTENFQIIVSTDFHRHKNYTKYGQPQHRRRIDIQGSEAYQDAIQKQKTTFLNQLSKQNFIYEEKMNDLCKILTCIKNVKLAPPGMQTIVCIKWFVFDLLFDVRLYFLSQRNYDFIGNVVSTYKYVDSHSTREIFAFEDPSHVLKRICTNMTSGHFRGANHENWRQVAFSGNHTFTSHWYQRDIQNVPVTLEFLSEETENALRLLGHIDSAQFCRMSRYLWLVFDSRRISMQEKFIMLQRVLSY